MNYYNDIFCIETGDEPGNGRYLCVNCNIVIELDDKHTKVPFCPCCEQHLFYPKRYKSSDSVNFTEKSQDYSAS